MSDGELLREVRATHLAVQEARASMDEQNRLRDRRIRTNRVLNGVVAFVAAVGIVVGIGAWRAFTVYRHDQAAARVAACDQYNRKQDLDAIFQDRHDRKWSELLAPPPRSPEVQRRVDDALRSLAKDTRAGKPHRGCTQAEIKAYLTPTTKGN